MESARKETNEGWKNTEKTDGTPRTDAAFTEIYELIFHNETMVRSELAVLMQLIQKKYMKKMTTPPLSVSSCAHKAYRKQAVVGKTI